MDKVQVVERVKLFAELAVRKLDVQQVILFGSYARGTATEMSDIDVAVVTGTPPKNWWKASTDLFRLRRDIDLSIEPVLIDSSSDRSGFLEHVRKTGELIYDRDST